MGEHTPIRGHNPYTLYHYYYYYYYPPLHTLSTTPIYGGLLYPP